MESIDVGERAFLKPGYLPVTIIGCSERTVLTCSLGAEALRRSPIAATSFDWLSAHRARLRFSERRGRSLQPHFNLQ